MAEAHYLSVEPWVREAVIGHPKFATDFWKGGWEKRNS
jgi:hypothetical protein